MHDRYCDGLYNVILIIYACTAEFMIANLRGRGRSPEAKDGTVEASTVHGHEYYYSSL